MFPLLGPCSVFSGRKDLKEGYDVRNVPVPPTYSSAPAGLELATVKPVAGYPGVFGVFGVHGVHGELTRPPFVAHPSTQDITATRGLRHGTKHRRHCAQTMINGCLVGFLGDSHRDVTALGYYISLLLERLYFPRFDILGFSEVTTQEFLKTTELLLSPFRPSSSHIGWRVPHVGHRHRALPVS